MLRRAPHSPQQGTGWLMGWRLTFGGEDLSWEGALATVVEDPEGQVYVALYDVSPADQQSLDDWEGGRIGLYRKLRVRVQTLDGEVVAWLYVLDGYEGGLPTARYLGQLADAADLITYVQLCDGPLITHQEGWVEAVRERLLPGASEFPLADILRPISPQAVIEAEVPQTAARKAGVSALDRARLAVDAMRACLARSP